METADFGLQIKRSLLVFEQLTTMRLKLDRTWTGRPAFATPEGAFSAYWTKVQ